MTSLKFFSGAISLFKVSFNFRRRAMQPNRGALCDFCLNFKTTISVLTKNVSSVKAVSYTYALIHLNKVLKFSRDYFLLQISSPDINYRPCLTTGKNKKKHVGLSVL